LASFARPTHSRPGMAGGIYPVGLHLRAASVAPAASSKRRSGPRSGLRDKNAASGAKLEGNSKPCGVFHVGRLRGSLGGRLEVNALVVLLPV